METRCHFYEPFTTKRECCCISCVLGSKLLLCRLRVPWDMPFTCETDSGQQSTWDPWFPRGLRFRFTGWIAFGSLPVDVVLGTSKPCVAHVMARDLTIGLLPPSTHLHHGVLIASSKKALVVFIPKIIPRAVRVTPLLFWYTGSNYIDILNCVDIP